MATTQQLTVEDYERIVFSNPDRQWELHEGQQRGKPGRSWEHLDVIVQLAHLLKSQLDGRLDRVFAEGRVRRSEATIFIPDVLVVPTSLAPAFIGRPGTLTIIPEPLPLVVEVWSASTGNYDVDAKLPIYQERGDLEIWLIHPYNRTVTAWRLQPDGAYDEALYRDGAITLMALQGVTIQLDDLFDFGY